MPWLTVRSLLVAGIDEPFLVSLLHGLTGRGLFCCFIEIDAIAYNVDDPADPNPSQEYFSGTVGPVKRAYLTYGPDGQSRGIATIVFSGAASAAKAAKELDAVAVDGRPMRVRDFPRKPRSLSNVCRLRFSSAPRKHLL
jgi:hypothetical protein